MNGSSSVRVFDSRPVFNVCILPTLLQTSLFLADSRTSDHAFSSISSPQTLLDNADVLGFYNSTGFAGPYSTWTLSNHTLSGEDVQIDPYAPVASYFWTNNFHPTWRYVNASAPSSKDRSS